MNLVDTSRSVSCLVVIEDGEGESTEDGPYEVTVVPAPPACEGLTPKPKAIRVRPARLRSRPSRRRQAYVCALVCLPALGDSPASPATP